MKTFTPTQERTIMDALENYKLHCEAQFVLFRNSTLETFWRDKVKLCADLIYHLKDAGAGK
jgi:hypothetical protein